MATVTLKGNPITTCGELPLSGGKAPFFTLTASDLSDKTLDDYAGKNVVLNIFPSIDTPVCANSVRRFNTEAGNRENTVVLCISADLPFAHSRFCEGEGLKNVIPLSTFRNPEFGKDYGVTIVSGPISGLLARSVVVINPQKEIVYTELVPETGQEPDYEAALKAIP